MNEAPLAYAVHIYRCRPCSQIVDEGFHGLPEHIHRDTRDACAGQGHALLLSWHRCNADSVGICDLIGSVPFPVKFPLPASDFQLPKTPPPPPA